jgi:O-antigen ligase
VKQATDAVTAGWEIVNSNWMRRAGFSLTLAFLFLRITALHELLASKLGFNTYILFLVGPPAIICLLLSGGLQRMFSSRTTKYWLAFLVLLILAVPFSSWRGGSATLVSTYMRTEFIVLPLVVGLGWTFQELWKLLVTLAVAGGISSILGTIYASELAFGGGRTEVSFGTMSDPNDFAAHLIFILPFMALFALSKRNFGLRVGMAVLMLLALYRVLASGSRGALIALLVTAVFIFLRGKMSQKIVLLIGGALLGSLMLAMLPGQVSDRLMSLFADSEEERVLSSNAATSRESRTYLLMRSLTLTMEHPIFGVGPGEFANYESNDMMQRRGIKGAWHDTHNSYTQISSEVGIAAAVLYLTAIISTYLLLRRIYKLALQLPPGLLKDRAMLASGTLMVSLVGFGSAAFFLSLAYRFYFPVLTAIAVVLYRSLEHESRKLLQQARNNAEGAQNQQLPAISSLPPLQPRLR